LKHLAELYSGNQVLAVSKGDLTMLNFLRKLKERWSVEQACRQTLEIYKTGTAEERQQIEDLLWEVGRQKNDMAQAEAVVKSLRQIL
jgi:hypothetical protein